MNQSSSHPVTRKKMVLQKTRCAICRQHHDNHHLIAATKSTYVAQPSKPIQASRRSIKATKPTLAPSIHPPQSPLNPSFMFIFPET